MEMDSVWIDLSLSVVCGYCIVYSKPMVYTACSLIHKEVEKLEYDWGERGAAALQGGRGSVRVNKWFSFKNWPGYTN